MIPPHRIWSRRGSRAESASEIEKAQPGGGRARLYPDGWGSIAFDFWDHYKGKSRTLASVCTTCISALSDPGSKQGVSFWTAAAGEQKRTHRNASFNESLKRMAKGWRPIRREAEETAILAGARQVRHPPGPLRIRRHWRSAGRRSISRHPVHARSTAARNEAPQVRQALARRSGFGSAAACSFAAACSAPACSSAACRRSASARCFSAARPAWLSRFHGWL